MLSSNSRWNVDVPPYIDIEERQERNRQRMKSRFERIFEQYERDFSGQDDEIDLETGDIVVNNGHLESMPDHDGSGQFGRLLNFDHNAQYHDDFFHDAVQRPRGDDEEDELAAMCPVGLLAAAGREPSPRPAGSPAASPIPQANAPEETPHETSGKLDQVTEMERQIQQMSQQLQELRQLVTQPSIQPRFEPGRPKDPKWYAPPLPNLPRRYEMSKDSVWDAPTSPEHPSRQPKPNVSSVNDIEELKISRPTKATAWNSAFPVENVRRPWTEEENKLIVELRSHQNLLFREIAARLPGRTTAQVVTHWHAIKDRLDKENTVSESLEKNSKAYEEASDAATRRREKLPLRGVDKNSKEINPRGASSVAQESETSNESNTDEIDRSVAQPPVNVQLESNTDQRRFRRSRRKTLPTQSFVLPHDRSSASPPAAAQQPATDSALKTTRGAAQPPEYSHQSSTQSRAKEVREWCKSKIGATDNPRRPYFCQLCGHYWQTEEKVMSHFSQASGCKGLPLRRLRQPSKPSEPWTCVRCCQTWPTKAGADSHGAESSSCQPIALEFPTTDKAPHQRTSPNGDDFEDQPIPPSPVVLIPAWPWRRHNPLNVSPKAKEASNDSSETNGTKTRRHRNSFVKRTLEDVSDPPANETPLAKRTKTDKAFTTLTPTAPAGESVQYTSLRLPRTKGIMDGSCAGDHAEKPLSTGTELIQTPPTSFVEDAVDLSENSDGELASLFEEPVASEAATGFADADDTQWASKATPAPTATQSQASSTTWTAACAALNTPNATHKRIEVGAERNMTADEVPQAEFHGARTQEPVRGQEETSQSPELVASETQATASPDGPPDSEDNFGLDLDDSAIESMIEDPDSFIVESTEVDPDPAQLIPYLSPTKSESEDELQKASSPCPVLSENAVMLPKPQAGSSSPAYSPARRRRSQGRKLLAISLLDKEAPITSPRTPRQQPPTKASERSLAKSSTRSAVSSFKTPVKPASASKRSNSGSSRKARQTLSAKSNDAKNSPTQKSSALPKPRKSRLSDMLLPGDDSDDDLF